MKKTVWYIRKRNADYEMLSKMLGISLVCVRIMRNRGAETPGDYQRFLNGSVQDLTDPARLNHAREAADLLEKWITEGRKIRIIGDYDVDGICAAAILYKGLCGCGANADYTIPDRITDGYGLNMRLVNEAVEDGVEALITCDNGISAAAQIQEAKNQGLEVIVTDHHLPAAPEDPEESTSEPAAGLPPADVIVDPSVPGEIYPYPGMCGAVVAWRIMQLLTGSTLEELLPLAALATVCDVMDLKDENRVIVRSGLEAMRRLRTGGLYALIRQCGLDPSSLTAYDLGFRIGPCLNAGGRLDTALRCMDLLLSDRQEEADDLAAELVSLNEQRRIMTENGIRQAVHLIETTPLKQDKIYVVYLPECHQSLAGIIAGRIKESYAHPAIVLTDSNEADVLKGSGRSIEGWHMYNGLSGCKELLVRYGGHPMAAGLTMKKELLDIFREELNRQCTLEKEDFVEKKMIDMELPFSNLSFALAEDIKKLEPFGKGNERPAFVCRNVKLTYGKVMGVHRNVFRCTATDGTGVRYPAVWFGDADSFVKEMETVCGETYVRSMLSDRGAVTVNLMYFPRINEYNGVRTLQLQIVDYKTV